MNKQVLDYTKKAINKNFRIKVAGVDADGNKINTLVGVAGAIALIGVELLNKFLKRASPVWVTLASVNFAEV